MVTVEELVVKATPKGVGDVEESLEGMEDKAEETTDSIEEQSSALGVVAGKFKGAMGAVVAGFAVVTASLLSRIPVLSTSASGLGAILDALGIKISQKLAPAIDPVNKKLFEFAREINKGDSAAAKIVTTIATAIVVLGGLASAAVTAAGIILTVSRAFGLVRTAARVVTGAITGLIASFGLIPVLLGGLILALAAFALAYTFNWFGIRDTTDEVVNDIVTFVTNAFNTFVTEAGKFLKKLVKRAKTEFTTLKVNTRKALNDLIDSAIQSGKDLVSSFAQGIRDNISEATSAAKGLAARVKAHLPFSPAETGPLSDLDETGPGLVNTFAAGINANVGTATAAANNLAGGVDPAQSALAGDDSRTVISIDGREVERATQSFRDNGTDLRGRYG